MQRVPGMSIPHTAPGKLHVHCQHPVLPLPLREMCFNVPTLMQKIIISEYPFRVERLNSPKLNYCISGGQHKE